MASKDEIAKQTKEAKEKAKKSKDKTEVDTKKITEVVTKQFVEEALPICEKSADDDYKSEKKALVAKLASAEKALKQKEEAIIKVHEKTGKSK